MVHFGPITNPALDPISEIRTFRRIGFDFIEIGIEPPRSFYPELLQMISLIKKELINCKPYCLGHALYWLDLGSQSEIFRKSSIRVTKKLIDMCRRLHIPFITIHSYSPGMSVNHGDVKTIQKNYVKSMRVLVEFAKKHKVKILLENMPPGTSIAKLEDFKPIVDEVPTLGVTFDVSHAYSIKKMKTVRSYLKQLDNKIQHIHINNQDNTKKHLPLYKGKIDYRTIVKMLKKVGYEGTITLEINAGKDKTYVAKSLEFIKNIWWLTS